MLDIQTQLFEGRDIRLGPIDHETDPQIESKWTHDSEFVGMSGTGPARPMSAAMVKKLYEKLEKEIEKGKGKYYFTIRAKENDRLIGRAIVEDIEWANGHGYIRIDIGAAGDRGQGYGSQALHLLLRYAFAEINMKRVTLSVFEYNPRAIRSYEKAGFRHEGRLRKLLNKEGRRWDMLTMGILREEWMEQHGHDITT